MSSRYDWVNVAVAGAGGRLGAEACQWILDEEGLELCGLVDTKPPGESLSTVLEDEVADVLLDLTTPEAAPENAIAALEAGVHVVIGTTGFDLGDLEKRVGAVSGDARCLVVPNFAIGAVLMMRFAAEAARYFPKAEIVEMHHPAKLDSPSGTAKRTAKMIEGAGGEVADPIHSVRLLGLLAHQEVIFGSEGQTLTLRHDAINRKCFMPGIILAVRKVAGLTERFSVGLEAVLD